MRLTAQALGVAAVATLVRANASPDYVDKNCPGYKATNVKTSGGTITADLELAGKACNVYGTDVQKLKLAVTYETETRIHLKITDPGHDRYEVPESVLALPSSSSSVSPSKSAIQFKYTSSPFSFSIVRAKSGEALFNTAKHPLVFEPQYLRLMSDLPANANLYGLGEHTDPLRLPTHNYTRTFWSRDAYGIANGTNLYGNHPVYYEHRTSGTHGVFLRNSNGLAVKVNDTTAGKTTLEYNAIGGVVDLYFLAGSTSDPVEVARQYAQLVGTPAEVPYWSFGLHQCRFGYKNFVDVAGVISNYSAAGIPLETMWTDIDYMDRRRVFTLDEKFFPMKRMQEIVHHLHDHDQKYIVMVDPAVAYVPNNDYTPYDRGQAAQVWINMPNGTSMKGVVWPGVTVYPDWFNPATQPYWNDEFNRFFSPSTGLDIDGVWIDMNEPASFCDFPCSDPFAAATQQGLPPIRTDTPPDPNTPIFTTSARRGLSARAYHGSDENLITPPFAIGNAAGDGLPARTSETEGVHSNGLIEYDAHNVYGTMMSTATRNAMEQRRPGKRTLIITRSTFAGAGHFVGKWLGDNLSTWWHYRVSIAGMLGFASVYQVPMVGSDICGFGADTTETLCARWAMLGAFYPFMRNHNGDTSISQEFYRWPIVAAAAKNALDTRYRLLDYLYTAFHAASLDGTPVLHPLFYKYPADANTFGLDMQFFFGDAVLVSPVTEENVTSVKAYLPKDTWYEFATLAPVQGKGAFVELQANYTTIPAHIKGGAVVPMRVKGAMTTGELRKTDFELVVAPAADGTASGKLYVDDGESIVQTATTEVQFEYKKGKLEIEGKFGYKLGVKLARVRFAGVEKKPKEVRVKYGGKESKVEVKYNAATKVLEVPVGVAFDGKVEVELKN